MDPFQVPLRYLLFHRHSLRTAKSEEKWMFSQATILLRHGQQSEHIGLARTNL